MVGREHPRRTRTRRVRRGFLRRYRVDQAVLSEEWRRKGRDCLEIPEGSVGDIRHRTHRREGAGSPVFLRLTFTQEVNEFVLLVFVELRGPTAPEVRSEFTETSFVPASDPVRGGALRFPDVISGFLQRGTFVQLFEKDEAFEFLLIVRLAEEPIQIPFTQVPHDFLLPSSHYTKEILLLNNFAESLTRRSASISCYSRSLRLFDSTRVFVN